MRISAFTVTLLLVFGFVACGGADEADTTDETTDTMAPGAESEPTAGGLSSPPWMQVDESAQTVSMDIRAGETEANNRWNFSGLYAGAGEIVVPQGYSVTINFTNADPNQPHSIGIGQPMDSYPATFESPQPVFAGALSADATTSGTAPNQSETLSFTTDQAGDFAMICYVPGHAVAGMVVPFRVSGDGTYGVRR